MDTATSPPVRLAYSDEKAAELLDVGRGTVRNLITAGKLRTIQIGRHVKVPHSELERYIREQLDTT